MGGEAGAVTLRKLRDNGIKNRFLGPSRISDNDLVDELSKTPREIISPG